MKIVVCVKLVKVLGDEVEFTKDGLDVDPDYLEHALNEWDACAVEEALRIRERLGEAEVVAVTAGDKKSEDALPRPRSTASWRAAWSMSLRWTPPPSLPSRPASISRGTRPCARSSWRSSR